jgi:hypothetical protein
MGDKPVYHDERTRDPRRDLIRQYLPKGSDGFVYEDLDLVPRVFTSKDPVGRFALVEFKWNGTEMGTAQRKTFGLIHSTLRAGDPSRERYIGFYVVNWPGTKNGDSYLIDFTRKPKINGVEVTGKELTQLFRLAPPYRQSLFDAEVPG